MISYKIDWRLNGTPELPDLRVLKYSFGNGWYEHSVHETRRQAYVELGKLFRDGHDTDTHVHL